ncbi:DUF3311 domain-containing protein [Caballeronia sp. LP006]|uniref:DUF3311 domain-containing protein n=1 Tax=Caballeronia sp. LP006 TaxID=3038552 RepID=UPI00285E26AB|nr:DUF3311 domain-containing protein [Caballeronia sp. LP006]MDR5826299.1 DUF3311 domain-containing protein [Caballeronia sp. LP006]
MKHLSDRRTRQGRWYWGFLIPLALVLGVPFYNRDEPTLWGLPFFYWSQLLFVVIGALVTGAIYRLTPDRESFNNDQEAQ